jgi:hypothetical protein
MRPWVPVLAGRPRHADVLTPAEWSIVDFVRHGISDRGITTDPRGQPAFVEGAS